MENDTIATTADSSIHETLEKSNTAENEVTGSNTEADNTKVTESNTEADNTEADNTEADNTESNTEEDLVRDEKTAMENKVKGNEAFMKKEYKLAMEFYEQAIKSCPLTEEMGYSRAVFYANKAACWLHLGDHAQAAVDDCGMAIGLAPKYIKAYLRRAQALELLERYEDSLKDYQSVLEMDNTVQSAKVSEKRLKKLMEERNEKLKEETLDKLKGLGNMVLGKFGMSTDDFKMVKDENTGGYSVNYSPTPK